MVLPGPLVPRFPKVFQSDPLIIKWSNSKSHQAWDGTASAYSFPETVIVFGFEHDYSNQCTESELQATFEEET